MTAYDDRADLMPTSCRTTKQPLLSETVGVTLGGHELPLILLVIKNPLLFGLRGAWALYDQPVPPLLCHGTGR